MHFTQPAQLIAALLLLLVSLSAQAVYKCASAESGIIYSDIPCNASAEKLKQPHTQSEKPSVKDQHVREKAELNRLQNLRELRERQDTQILHMQQRSLEAKRKRCQALALDKKWKQEDASSLNLPLKQQAQAQKKLRRATEKYQASCE
ncbi:MAG: hypothetical protein RI984_1591 [Pseudomonadota bacterium]|jgi:hypothetical protein